MKRERANRVAELQLLEKRLRDESRHDIDSEKRKSGALEKAIVHHTPESRHTDTRFTP